MQSLKESPANRTRILRAEVVLASMLREVLDHGFYGRAVLELVIQDGTIQRIGRLVESHER